MDKPVVLITGGLTGIGRAAAVAFARNGANVFMVRHVSDFLSEQRS
jgi:NAD(P)-dependent dehydrogenase (short-subunit alcohol dehydrogenase family)